MLVIEKNDLDGRRDPLWDFDAGFPNSQRGRIKNAAQILYGKPAHYNDGILEGEVAFRKLMRDMQKLEKRQFSQTRLSWKASVAIGSARPICTKETGGWRFGANVPL